MDRVDYNIINTASLYRTMTEDVHLGGQALNKLSFESLLIFWGYIIARARSFTTIAGKRGKKPDVMIRFLDTDQTLGL